MDTDRVSKAEKIISQYRENKIAERKSLKPLETQASLSQVPVIQSTPIVPQEDTVALTQERTNTLIDEQITRMSRVSDSTRPVIQTVKEDTKVVINTPAVNDPLYFKSSEAIITGMNKVIDLNKYLNKNTLARKPEKEFKARLPAIGTTISLCQKELSNPANK